MTAGSWSGGWSVLLPCQKFSKTESGYLIHNYTDIHRDKIWMTSNLGQRKNDYKILIHTKYSTNVYFDGQGFGYLQLVAYTIWMNKVVTNIPPFIRSLTQSQSDSQTNWWADYLGRAELWHIFMINFPYAHLSYSMVLTEIWVSIPLSIHLMSFYN